ncbi:hypothetical protein RR46_00326 [Papilio xuthus]|uniref:Uncharacterized protein n=1 Tax=Papilio xuthus TaxID=66420 RepID=A0A0N1PFJ5_PAPXU|nr:hypothetical protein RR46_00326 [Papilio xuthus]
MRVNSSFNFNLSRLSCEGAYGSQHSPVSRSDASTEDAELSAALAHQHHLAMQAGEYQVSGVEPDYGQYVSSPAAHYNHMGHLTMAPSQKYPHVMDSVSVSGGVYGTASGAHYGTYAHYGAAYPAQPAYLVEPGTQVPAYMAQVSSQRVILDHLLTIVSIVLF